MTKANHKRSSKLRRSVNQRHLQRKVHVVCEGKKTEPLYIRALLRQYSGIKPDFDHAGGVPTTLLDKAKALLGSTNIDFSDSGDRIWVIFDCDEHPSINQVLNECEKLNVTVGFTNPCFELWLLWHCIEFGAQDDRHAIKRRLSAESENYCHRKERLNNVEEILTGLKNAVRRSERSLVARRAEGDPRARPVSTMHEIIASLNEMIEGMPDS